MMYDTRPPISTTNLRKKSQQGLTLVELAIILAVVGIVLGASLVPLGQIWRTESYREQRDTMALYQDAILGYALTHATAEHEVVVTGATSTRTYTIPAGRPYLPCPDVDGDGYEDRGGIPVPGVLPPPTSYVINSSTNELLTEGNCLLSRGLLPHKTLGVPAADRWGNRYTYHVDDMFSNAAVGFNHETLADSFDYRMTVEVNSNGHYVYARRDDSIPVDATRGGTSYSFDNKRRPIVVCSGDVDICQDVPGIRLQLAGGKIAIADYDASRREYEVNDIIEGAVYALVSHGENGHGAVRHNEDTVFLQMHCNYPSNSATPSAGLAAVGDHLRNEAVNFPFVEEALPNAIRYCAPGQVSSPSNIDLSNGFFAALPLSSRLVGTRDQYDDIVVWTMRQELLQQLVYAGKMPVPPLPLFRAY